MKRVKGYEDFLNEGIMEIYKSIAKKLEAVLDKAKEYSFAEIANLIPEKGGVAALHSRDVKAVIHELTTAGYKIATDEE